MPKEKHQKRKKLRRILKHEQKKELEELREYTKFKEQECDDIVNHIMLTHSFLKHKKPPGHEAGTDAATPTLA